MAQVSGDPDGAAPFRPVGQGDSGTSGARLRGWPVWGWVLLVGGALAGAVVVAVISGLLGLRYATACYDTPTLDQARAGRQALAVVSVVAMAPWLVAAAFAHRRLRLVVAGVVCASPAILGLIMGWNLEAWRGTYCF